VAERVARFLLNHQLVRSDLLPNRLWQVAKGSGMGLKHSSALCDAALYAMCERPFILKHVVLRVHGIRLYRRFKDDMFAIVSNPGLAGRWLQCVKGRCQGTFAFECIECSQYSVTMLALKIWKGPGRGILTCPRERVLDGPVLSITSAHDLSLHQAWPVALLRSQLKFTSASERKNVVYNTIQRFKRHYAPDPIIFALTSEAARWECNQWVCRQEVKKSSKLAMEGNVAWMVLPSHPAFRRGRDIQKAVKALQACVVFSTAWKSAWRGNALVIHVSWKNSLSHSVHTFQSVGRAVAFQFKEGA
jgi:hypothetical protein